MGVDRERRALSRVTESLLRALERHTGLVHERTGHVAQVVEAQRRKTGLQSPPPGMIDLEAARFWAGRGPHGQPRRHRPRYRLKPWISNMLPSELGAIVAHVAGMNNDQVRLVRDRIVAEVRSIEARFRERLPMDDPGRFQLERDRLTCARRRREVDYLNQLLEVAHP
jgi:hypothetical protein